MARPVPNTITDKQWADIRRRAAKVAPPLFSAEATRGRLAASAQQRKANLS